VTSDRFSAPTYVYLQVSRECGGCSLDCYASPDGNSLTLKEAKSIVDMVAEAKVFFMLIDGGEPLLWDHIGELVSHIRSKRMLAAVVSGGEDISKAEALKKADLSMIQFPIEGPEEYHDKIRGEGMFQKTLEGIKTFCDLKIPTHVGTVVSPSNLCYLEEISDIVSPFPIKIHRILRYIHPTEYLTPEQCIDALSRVYALAENGSPITPTNCYTFVKQTPYVNRMDVTRFQGCVGGKTTAVITCEGYVVPCPHFASKKAAEAIGAPSLWETDMRTIWREWDFLKEFRRGLKACQTCEDLLLCGGCRAAAYHVTGGLDYDPGCPVSAGTT
jgi:radical SAM protein with 4Fe4S-binding SPASM domain